MTEDFNQFEEKIFVPNDIYIQEFGHNVLETLEPMCYVPKEVIGKDKDLYIIKYTKPDDVGGKRFIDSVINLRQVLLKHGFDCCFIPDNYYELEQIDIERLRNLILNEK